MIGLTGWNARLRATYLLLSLANIESNLVISTLWGFVLK
jgi:hypothetical protein